MEPFNFHPEAQADLENIWDFIATDSIDAADRVVAEFFRQSEKHRPSLMKDINAPI